MAVLEIYTVGGGPYIVNVLNAVAAWCGGGGFRSLLQVVMVMGLIYSLIIVAFSMNWRVMFNWFLSSTALYLCMIVPTTTVIVIDSVTTSAGTGTVGNVPIGLALIASVSSQANKWLTETAESLFTMPGALDYSNAGMIYPIRTNDVAKEFEITDPILKADVEGYIQNCTFYDILLGQGNTWSTLANSPDLLTALGPGSPARSTPWIPANGGVSTIVPCQTAYQTMQSSLPTLATTTLNNVGKVYYPSLTTGQGTKLGNDISAASAYLFGPGGGVSGQQYFQQRSLVNAFMEARANFGAGGGDTFAAMHADVQTENSYLSGARQAMTWVPVLNIVLTVIFYAMFPVIFPLFLLPQTGMQAFKGYTAGFFYLAAWGPLCGLINMFIGQYAATQLTALAPGGPTLGSMAAMDSIDQNMAMLAGYLMMSVPVLAAGMAKGAMSVAGSAGAMLAPAIHGGEAAAVERTTGNYSYGNEHFQNVTGNQVNTAPTWTMASSTSPQVNMRQDNGSMMSFMPSGDVVTNTQGATSKFGFNATEMQGVTANLQASGAEYHSRANQLRESSSERWSQGMRELTSASSGSRSGSGSESSSGAQGGNNTTRSDKTGTENRDQVGNSRTIGDTLSSGSTYNTALQKSATGRITGGVSGSTPGKFLGFGASAGISAEGALSKNSTSGSNESKSGSDAKNQSQSSNVSTYHANGQDVTLTDGGYYRDGTFHRVEGFSEKRHAIEHDLSQAQSLERQASKSDEVGARIERIASESQSHGYQISDDMNQVIASRYAEMANSAEFRDLGAPSLTNVTPSAHQREVRNMIVSRVLEEYAANDTLPIEAMIKDPSAMMGGVKGPEAINVPSSMPSPASVHSKRTGSTVQNSGELAPGDENARATIAQGTSEMGQERAAATLKFDQVVADHSKSDETIKRTLNN
jgi:conjugal transfer mating pair stabilization protein TraG